MESSKLWRQLLSFLWFFFLIIKENDKCYTVLTLYSIKSFIAFKTLRTVKSYFHCGSIKRKLIYYQRTWLHRKFISVFYKFNAPPHMCTVILHPFNVKWLEWRLMTINIDPTCENVILEKCFRPRLMWQLVPDGKFQTRLSILWWMLWETCFQWIHLIYRMISTLYIYHQDSELSLPFVRY